MRSALARPYASTPAVIVVAAVSIGRIERQRACAHLDQSAVVARIALLLNWLPCAMASLRSNAKVPLSLMALLARESPIAAPPICRCRR